MKVAKDYSTSNTRPKLGIKRTDMDANRMVGKLRPLMSFYTPFYDAACWKKSYLDGLHKVQVNKPGRPITCPPIIHRIASLIRKKFPSNSNIIRQVNMMDIWAVPPLNRSIIEGVGAFPSRSDPTKLQLPSTPIRASLDDNWCFLIG